MGVSINLGVPQKTLYGFMENPAVLWMMGVAPWRPLHQWVPTQIWDGTTNDGPKPQALNQQEYQLV